jgi:hypothetical protein
VIAFNLGQHHAYDVGSFLDNYGIAVRTGHHCAMPLMALSGTGHVSGIAGDVQYHGRGGPPGGGPPADPQIIRVKDVTMAALPDKDKLLRNFSRCANWEEKYLYIIELGQRLAPLSGEHTAQNIIQGCQSQVWIVMAQDPSGVIALRGDSDAAIVKGLIAVVFILYDQMTARISPRLTCARGLKKWR